MAHGLYSLMKIGMTFSTMILYYVVTVLRPNGAHVVYLASLILHIHFQHQLIVYI